MAEPSVSVSADKTTPYLPGSPVTVSWSVVDADNGARQIELTGVDSQGNDWSGSLVIQTQDEFRMTSVVWDNGQPLLIDNVNRKATGMVPSA